MLQAELKRKLLANGWRRTWGYRSWGANWRKGNWLCVHDNWALCGVKFYRLNK